jgi:hypothetical protein
MSKLDKKILKVLFENMSIEDFTKLPKEARYLLLKGKKA